MERISVRNCRRLKSENIFQVSYYFWQVYSTFNTYSTIQMQGMNELPLPNCMVLYELKELFSLKFESSFHMDMLVEGELYL